MRRIVVAALSLAILVLIAILAWNRSHSRPSGVPATAVLVEGQYVDCIQAPAGLGEPCKVYDARSGKLVDTNPFSIRLRAFSRQQGGHPIDCGKTSARTPDAKVAHCVQAAFGQHSPFTAEYITDFGSFPDAYGIAGNAKGDVAEATYDSRSFPAVRPNKRTQLLDENKVRFTSCVQPIALGTDGNGLVGCIVPVNGAASIPTQTKPIDTTICAITDNPAAFNNKLVRVKGSYSGNFEYSMLSQDGCSQAIWFNYASEDAPPGLVVHVQGEAWPGAEDEKGWRILPLPVSLVRDKNFKRFQELMKARVEAEKRADKSKPAGSVSYRVTATFVGRIDGVSSEIHEFHKKIRERPDSLGFGHMGLFDAQLIMQSVEGDAVLEKER